MRTPQPPVTNAAGFCRVLVVDRHIDALRRVRDLLQSNGNFHVAGARDCHEATALIAQGTFDAAIVDVALWAESGVDLLRAIQEGTPELAVIVLDEAGDYGPGSVLECHADDAVFREHLGDGRHLAERVVSAVAASRSGRRRDTIVRWLERDARTDRLTGLLNRTGFMESLSLSAEVARASDGVVGLILLKVCGTSDVSESRGPAQRDDLLRRAAIALSRSVRGADVAARSDRSEFAVIVEGGAIDLLRIISRRIAHQVERLNLTEWADDLPVAVEFGLASAMRPDAQTLYGAARAQLTPEDDPPPRSMLDQGLFDEDGPSVA